MAAKPKHKHSVVIAGHATSITLEPEFWAQLQRSAAARKLPLAVLIGEIDKARTTVDKTAPARNLSSALRVHVLDFVLSEPRG